MLAVAIAPVARAEIDAFTVRHHTEIPALYGIDLTSGEVQEIGSFNLPDLLVTRGLAYLPSGELMSISVTGALVRVDPGTGEATPVGNLGTTFYPYSLDLAADACGRLWMLVAAGPTPSELWRIDPATGSGEAVGVLPQAVYGLAATGETLYGLVRSSTPEEADIVRIDPEALTLTPVATLGDWPYLDPLDLDFDSEGGMISLGSIPPPIPVPVVHQLVQRFDLAGNPGPSLGPAGFGAGFAVAPPPGHCLSGAPLAVPTLTPLGAIALGLLLATAGTAVLRWRRSRG